MPIKTWDCPKCGTKGNSGKFCPNCGEKAEKLIMGYYCQQCKKRIESAFCPECGNKASQIIDRGDYIEFDPPVGNIQMVEVENSHKEYSWEEAVKYANDLRKGGLSDWRLPTSEELDAIHEIEKEILPTNSRFWCNLPHSNTKGSAWNTGPYGEPSGTEECSEGNCHLRCVR